MPSNSPRQRRHTKNRQAILDVAARLIAKHGYEKLSLREVARQADYSPAGLYEYFKSKEDILLALSEQISIRMIAAMNEIPSSLPPRERVIQLGLVYIRYALENKEEFLLANALPSKRKSLNVPAMPSSPYVVVLDTVRMAISSGEIKLPKGSLDEEVTYSLWALVHGIAMLRLTSLENFQADFERVDRMAIVALINGLQ
jgi:AcrR family transcriptional regulator